MWLKVGTSESDRREISFYHCYFLVVWPKTSFVFQDQFSHLQNGSNKIYSCEVYKESLWHRDWPTMGASGLVATSMIIIFLQKRRKFLATHFQHMLVTLAFALFHSTVFSCVRPLFPFPCPRVMPLRGNLLGILLPRSDVPVMEKC